jgi:hypothetical protein
MPFNEFGEIIPDRSRPSANRNTNPGRPTNSFRGWWIVFILLLLFVAYEIVSNASKSNSQITTADTTKIDSTKISSTPANSPETTPTTQLAIDSSKLTDSIRNSDSLRKADSIVAASAGPYGQGNGKLTLYKTCNSCSNLEVSIDGQYVGTLSQTFDSSNLPVCDQDGTISKILTAGTHDITAKDDYGDTWNFQFPVKEGECLPHGLSKNTDTKPNPFGEGNGQITLYNTCSNCTNIQISIDGTYYGELTKYYPSSRPNCGTAIDGATIVHNLTKGSHTLSGKDDQGNKYEGTIFVTEANCQVYSLESYKSRNQNIEERGTVSFWTNQNMNYDLYVDGYLRGTLIRHFISEPSCGQFGALTINLPTGNHNFYARGFRSGWKGTFFVTAGECVNVKVNN